MDKCVLKITGMHCAACSASIERLLSKTEGISSASVNLATNCATVEYDPSIISKDSIKNSIDSLGFQASDFESSSSDDKNDDLSAMKRRSIIAICCAIPLLYVAMGHMLSLPLPSIISPAEHPFNFALLQFILTLPILIAGRNFFISGVKSVFHKMPNMDTLITMGTGAAFLYSIYAMVKIALGNLSFHENLFFESSAIVIALVMLGKYLEARSRQKASNAIAALTQLAPDTAIVDFGGMEVTVNVSALRPGDTIVVLPGSRFPCDGTVISGESSVDESLLTGESIPVFKTAGSPVIGGSINGEGRIKFTATKTGSDTTLSQIIRMVEDAQGKKAPIAKLADQISAFFVPAVFAIAVIAAILWAVSGQNAEFVLKVFVSVLVIACPCSLGLATPTAIMVGTGRGAQLGILFKSGEALQAASKVSHVALDKTGTITNGEPSLTDIISLSELSDSELLRICAAAESGSEHPVAKAICKAAEGIEPLEADLVTALPGLGVEASIGTNSVLVGNERLMTKREIDISEYRPQIESLDGKILMFAVINGTVAGILGAVDTVRDESRDAIASLHDLGLNVAMLTGDNEHSAKKIADEVGIDKVYSNILPGGKAQTIETMKKQGGFVAMVGDGINDAPALATADIGIAVSSGTDVAIESADIILIGEGVKNVSKAIALSRAVMRNIKQNLFWAFIYNSVGIPIAAGLLHAFGGPLLHPVFAGAAMALSSVSVVTNALRLRKFK